MLADGLPRKACEGCGNLFTYATKKQRFCTASCRKLAQGNKYALPSLKRELGISAGTVGALAELIVAVDLMKKGYQVFRALSPNCPADLVIYKNGHPLKVEVRTGYIRGSKVYTSRRLRGPIDIFAISTTDRIIYEPDLSE